MKFVRLPYVMLQDLEYINLTEEIIINKLSILCGEPVKSFVYDEHNIDELNILFGKGTIFQQNEIDFAIDIHGNIKLK